MEIGQVRYQFAKCPVCGIRQRRPGDLVKAGEFLGCTKDFDGKCSGKQLFGSERGDPVSGGKPSGDQMNVYGYLWKFQPETG